MSELLEAFVPRVGLPVSPGTKFVTVGGAVTADIHGKNHHVEVLLERMLSIDVMRADGSIVRCHERNILNFCIRLVWGWANGECNLAVKSIESARMRQQTIRASQLSELMDAFESDEEWTYSVAWVDSMVGVMH